MPELTVEHADELADQALRLKVAVGEFRNRFFATLTPEHRDGLQALHVALGDHLTAVAIQWTLADLEGTLIHLREITSGVNKAVEHMSEVRKVITIATALVDLGAAIASANPDGVLSALKNTAGSIQTETDPSP